MSRGKLTTVETRELGKVFGEVAALRGVDLRLESGTCTLLVGPNGAGKSTLLALMATLLRPSHGSLLYDGRTSSELGPELRGVVGFAAEEPFGYGELTGRENLLLRARLHRVASPGETVDRLVTELGLDRVADRPMAGYSQGERRRLGIAGALVHDPELLLLDEPTSGLDGAGAKTVLELVRRRVEQGAIVVVTTHDPWLGVSLGSRVVGLRAGRVELDEPAPSDESSFRAMLEAGGAS